MQLKTACLQWVLASVASAVGIGASSAAEPAPFAVFSVSDLVRVFEDGYGLQDERLPEIRVSGLRNEVVSAQLAIEAHEAVQDVTVVVGPLASMAGAAAIPAGKVQWNFVESIFIAENTPKLRPSDLTRPAPAQFPDLLSDERRCSIAKGAMKAAYLTISIPRDAEVGDYRTDVTVQSGGAAASLPLRLTVYPLTLPDERHLMATLWYSTNRFQQAHGVDSGDSERFWEMLRVYANNMADHRQNVFRVSMELIESVKGADGKLRFDFSRFDRWADVFWSTGKMDLLETGFVARFGVERWASREITLRDFSIRDESSGKTVRMPGEAFLPVFLSAFVQHLRQKGWLEKTVFHICDEPSNHNVLPWRAASELIGRHAPGLRRLDAIETPHCLGRLEVWCPKLDHFATWSEAFEEARRQGHELWFYTVGIFQKGSLPNKTADVALIESRVMHWLNYRYGATGYLHWGYNAWTDDPVKDPGKHRGDGWHVYPKQGGLLNSLRWEQMRNGIQDYECLWLLDQKLEAIRTTLSPRAAELIQPSRRGVEIASQVVRDFADFTRDPAVLYAARRQAIEEAMDLDQSPRVLLQTSPPEFSTVANDCAIDVHGWAEPGSRLRINGQETPVAADGLFLMETAPSREGTITLEAENAKGRKTLARKFRLAY